MADKKQQYKDRIEAARQAGNVVPAEVFKAPEAKEALSELLKQDAAKIKPAAPAPTPDAFSAAEEELRRRQYIGSAIDKSRATNDQRQQTGTQPTHDGKGNF